MHAHIRKPKIFYATTQTQAIKARAAWRRRHHRNRRPPRRDSPPGPHLREDHVGDARKCSRNKTANLRRDPTYATSKLRTAMKGTMMQLPKPTSSTAAGTQWGHTQPRSNPAGLLAKLMRKARVASYGSIFALLVSELCTRTFGH